MQKLSQKNLDLGFGHLLPATLCLFFSNLTDISLIDGKMAYDFYIGL